MSTVLLGTRPTHCSDVSVFLRKGVVYTVAIVCHTSFFSLVFKYMKNEYIWIKFIQRKALRWSLEAFQI